MKRTIILLALSVVFLITIVAQNPKSGKPQNTKPGKNSPKEDIRVNREYDEKGNLIKFDSIYSYSYSSDSTLKDFDFKDFPGSFGMNLDFFNDSAFGGSFFKDFDPFFSGSLMQHPDSLMNRLNRMHNFQFRNDSTMQGFGDFDDFFKQFQGLNHDSSATMDPFIHEFNFDSKAMKEMMEQMQRHMEQMQSHQQNLLKN